MVVDSDFLYVGLEQDKFQEATLVNLDPLSVRKRDFDYAIKQPGGESSLRSQIPDFHIQYTFSFQYMLEESESSRPNSTLRQAIPHVYFVMQQPDLSESRKWITKISRICSGDQKFHSYTELEITCENCEETGFGRVQKVSQLDRILNFL